MLKETNERIAMIEAANYASMLEEYIRISGVQGLESIGPDNIVKRLNEAKKIKQGEKERNDK